LPFPYRIQPPKCNIQSDYQEIFVFH